MPSSREVIAALYGAWRLARLDAGGMRWFDISIGGFWRSFFAAALAAPGYAYLVSLDLDEEAWSADPLSIVLVEGVTYLLAWAALPVLAIFLTRLFALTDRYIGFIVAYNWAAVLQTALFVFAAVLATGVVPAGLGVVLILAATVLIILYQWFIARTALETTAFIAAGFVATDIVAGLAIDAAAEALL